MAEPSTDGINGLDFLEKNQCTVDITQRTIVESDEKLMATDTLVG